jgi:hypothetical protein
MPAPLLWWLPARRPVRNGSVAIGRYFALRELDTVLKEARRARLKVEVPWDERDAVDDV